MKKSLLLIPLVSILVSACCLFKPCSDKRITEAWLFTDGLPGQGYTTEALVADASENLYVAGIGFGQTLFCQQTQVTGTHFSGVVLKFHPDRTCEWYYQFMPKNTDNRDDRCFANKVVVDKDQNILVCGGFYGSLTYREQLLFPYDSLFRGFIAKLDKNGGLLWAKEFRTAKNTSLEQLLVLPNGNFVAQGSNISKNGHTGDDDTFLVAFDPNGTKLWEKPINTALFDNADDLRLSKHNTFYSLTVGGERFSNSSSILIKEWDFAGNERWSFEQPSGALTQKGFLAVDENDNLWFATTFTAERTPFIFGKDTLRTSQKEDSYLAKFVNRQPAFSTVLAGSDVDYMTGLYDGAGGNMALTLNHGTNLTAFGKTYTISTPYAFTQLSFPALKPEQATATSYGVSFEDPGFPRNSQILTQVSRNGNEYLAGRISGTLIAGTDTLRTRAIWGSFIIAKRKK
ncbi:hypothetical protein WBJ53_11205 [Spirosoma sp. SC4-14]|uniref:hypothetical protein n=1 Tax=Spirosoma sp. SC4-14 TaxID=3128900 RepID=UPI0030D54389